MQPQRTPQETGDKIVLVAVTAVLLFPAAVLLGLVTILRGPLSALWRLVRHGPSSGGVIVIVKDAAPAEPTSDPDKPSAPFSAPPFGGR